MSTPLTIAEVERIAALEPKVNAFAHLAADQAMDGARKAEAALMSVNVPLPLLR